MLPVKILDMSGATYLLVDRCFSELAQIKYKNPTRCGGLVQSSNQRHMDDIRSSTNIFFDILILYLYIFVISIPRVGK
jgi:hypothetical protein